jgi:hypothetical protein
MGIGWLDLIIVGASHSMLNPSLCEVPNEATYPVGRMDWSPILDNPGVQPSSQG